MFKKLRQRRQGRAVSWAGESAIGRFCGEAGIAGRARLFEPWAEFQCAAGDALMTSGRQKTAATPDYGGIDQRTGAPRSSGK